MRCNIRAKKKLLEDVISIDVQSVLTLDDDVYEIKQVKAQLIKVGNLIQIDEKRIRLSRTKNGYGARCWFECPVCSRNTANLFFSEIIGCRKCCNLTYPMQNLTPNQNRELRLKKRILELQNKLQITDDECSYVIPIRSHLWREALFKPKYMHQKTFDLLHSELAFRQLELLRVFEEQYPLPG